MATFPEEVTASLREARELFRKQEYARAESVFGKVADAEKNPPLAIQEAMYYRAECQRLQGFIPQAADQYVSLMNRFPGTSYREQCCHHVFDIANQWLDDTREEMREAKEKADGKRNFVWPRFVSFEKSKPFLDREGRAIEKLEQVRMHDVNGPLADKALFLCGVVKMYNENYRDADHYFSQIYQRHPESPLTPKALELGIQCKHLSTGGSDYDGRKSAEARKMVGAALGNYPQLSNDKEMRAYLEGQMGSIDVQQAEKEFKQAEFYRRTGHPGSAYFYYELVRRRYPGTKYAKLAEERWNELRAEVEAEQGKQETKPATPVAQPGAPVAPAAPPKTLPASIQQASVPK
jgi:outer membrane protein assembly factor BamD (BamD/ComL family)